MPPGDRIVQIEALPFSLPFREPEESAKGRRLGFSNVLVRLETADGVVGFGEATGSTTGAPVESVRAAIEYLLPLCRGESVFATERLRLRLLGAGRMTNVNRLGQIAVAAIDSACWDATGRTLGRPVHALIGGAVREAVDCFAYSMKHEPAAVVEDLRQRVADGHSVAYLKVGVDARRDVAAVAAAREALGPGVRLRVDANEAWSLPEARRVCQALAPYDIDFVEAPVDGRNLSAMAELRALLPMPVAANEGIWSEREAAEAIRRGACDVVVVGPLWVGGLLPLQRLAALCAAHDVGYCLHAPPSSSVGMAAALHVVATLPRLEDGNQTYHAGHLGADIATGLAPVSGGALAVPQGAGLGVEVDEERVRALAAEYAERGGVPQNVPRLS